MTTPETPEAIAIIGLAGRFPQAANAAEFWRNLRAGRESISFFREDEIQWLPLDRVPRASDPRYVRARAVLEKAEWFDAGFFGMNPREASLMDPQHRVFLECAWEALEDAGCDPARFPGSIGLFAGASMNSYLLSNLFTNPGLVENMGLFPTMLLNDNDFIPTRVSYKLNLRGPSINVQTACSTSLVAVCLAAQQLLSYRCDAALAGGVSLTFPQRRGQYHIEGGIMSHDGHCRAFSAGATGTVVGDGVGIVVLKRLSDALAAGDHIRAVIKGTALNNDGSVKIGYTAPSSTGQAEVIALAHAEAGFAPETVSYIEAHGTATPLGDPIEVDGLTKAFGLGGERGQFCGLGSVKTNIGHLDITAGVAGLIKTVLALEARELPPSLHFERPNPKIDFTQTPFRVISRLEPWPRGATPRRAGVSSFGIGGTNAHVALEEAPELPAAAPARPCQLLTLSARSPATLASACTRLADALASQPALNLADVGWTLQTGRRAFAHRRAIVAGDIDNAIRQLRASIAPPVAAPEATPAVAFLLPGQGAQRVDMGRGLYDSEPAFRATVDTCCRHLEPHLKLDLRTILFPSAGERAAATARLDETAITQPALFVIEYALACLWMSWGVQPRALLGHSLGEYVAACLAGVFSLEDALAVVAARARMMQARPRGAMLAVRLDEAAASALVSGDVALAAVNAPGLCVLAGPVERIDELSRELAARGQGAKVLKTSHAFHSPAMEAVLAPFADLLRGVKLNPPALPVVSNLTGKWLTAEEATDPAYWCRHLRQTVRFADGIATLHGDNPPLLLEVGPGRTLSTLARQHPAAKRAPVPVSSLGLAGEDGEDDDLAAVLGAVGHLWVAGVPVDWSAFHQPHRRRRVPLPTYPFERQRHWIEPGAGLASAPTTFAAIAVQAPEAAEPADRPPTAAPAVAAAPADPLAALFHELAGYDFTGEAARVPFQQLGLDSLLLTQASFALRERFGVKVTMRQLIEDFPTFEKLAAHLAGAPGLHRPAAAPAGDLAAPAGDGDLVLPLTEAQKEIWYVSQLGPALSAAYNESSTLLLRGSLDRAALDRAIEDVRRRHESLRITIDPAGERQRITATGTPATAQWEDLSDTPAEGADRRLLERINDLCGQPFDLAAGPLWRVHVFQLAPDRHALVLVVHHIICDGWSQAVVLQDLGECYTARRQGTEPSLAPAPRFSEYARTEAAQLDSPPRAAAAQFWTERFADGAPVLEFPGDRPRPAVRTYAASHLHRRLQPETVAALRQLVTNQHSTPFTVLLAAYVTILHRMSGQDDVVVGVPAAPQVLAGLPGLVGHCVNLLPLRSRLDAAQDFASYLQATRQASLDAFEHWSHPFARLLRLLNLPRAANRVPLANVTFNLGRHRGTPRFADLVVESAGNPKRFVNFDLSFNLTEVADGFVVDCHYSTELFDADTIARLLARYEVVLQAAAAEPQRLVIRLPLLTPAERHQTVVEWNDNAVAWRRDQCLHELFEEQAARAPDATALIWGTERWSYRRLNELANQIAHRLRRLGVNREMPVGIHAGRTPDTVAALFGILKSGGAYVPLDPVYPADRIAYMLDDSRATLLVTDRRRVGDPPPATAAVRLDLLEDRAAVAREPVTNPERRARPEDLAYVIYTSGSTGRPKGVAIEHRNGVALANWARDVFPPQELAGVLAGTSFSFDLSIFEIFVTLGLGGTAILAENPLELGTIPARGQVTLVNSVPSVVAELLRLDLFSPSVHTVFMAGEALPDSLADRLLAVPHLKKVYEGYGPSETTTFTSCGLRQPGVRSNLGRPFPNTQYYVLDRHLELVPPGVPGEICIGGENVARGYLNQPALTREKFVPNPFSAVPGARLYRSGDLARQRPDGLLEFVGRVDHQVKIRGFRVEPGEIESVILRDPVLRQCVVVVVEPAPGDRRLAAYVVPVAGATAPGADRIRAAVAAALPDYMVPSFVVPLAELPLTGNGKVDRRALPAPVATTPAAAAAAAPAAPRSLTEQMLAEIWNDVLGRTEVGPHDNFFRLGGHSLLLTQVLARVNRAFNLSLPLRHVFDAPTIAELAAVIERALVEDIKSGAADSEPSAAMAVGS